MIIVNLFRFIFGYVCFTAQGGFTDRFINLCNIYSVPLFNISFKNNGIVACIPVNKIYKLKNVCKKSGVHLSLISEHGLYFSIKNNLDRPGLFASLLFYIAFCFTMQNFVWSIDIQESRNVSQQEVYDLLCENGLKFGTYIKDFDEIHCSRTIVNTLKDKIQWMAINIKGSKAFVEMHDYNIIEKDSSYGNPCNIIADFDGILLSIDTYNGETIAIPGNGVNKGDLLISGIVENSDLSVSYREARGEITALHKVVLNKKYEKNKKYLSVDKIKQTGYLYLPGVKIPFSLIKIKPVTHSHINTSYVSWNGSKLPFGKIEYTDLRLSKNSVEINEKKRSLLIFEEYSDYTYKLMSDSHILNGKLSIKVNKDAYIIDSVFICIDYIGEKQIINTNIF